MACRPPAVAGTFYPADPRELEATIASHLRRAAAEIGPGPAPKALIVPHAGYVYSGPVAAYAYARLAPLREGIRRVVLLGPAHRVAVRGLAAPESSTLLTPLGSVPVDGEALLGLQDLPQVCRSERAHALEHSLEVQLPFLQQVLGPFRLTPLVVGDASDTEVAEVVERLWGGDETLVVISSDLSHYHDYATARELDTATCRAIEALEPESLDGERACGYIPVRGLLCTARQHGLEVETLDLRSSGDTAGDRLRVVGYGAWAFVRRTAASKRGPKAEDAIDAALVDLARRSIASGLEHGGVPALDSAAHSPDLLSPGACFVTLRSPDGALRGCVGSLEATRSLAHDVVANARAAASRDPRVPPIRGDELSDLEIEVATLGPLEAIPAHSLDDVVKQLRAGEDGLVLVDGDVRGTLLPKVWEQLPEPRAFAEATWEKAGLPVDHWSSSARAFRYRVERLAKS